MAKRLNWEKDRKNRQVRSTRTSEIMHRVHEDIHDMMVEEFFAHVAYYEKRGEPIPEFEIEHAY